MSKTFTNLNIWVSLLILNTVFISHQLMAKDNLDPLPSWHLQD